MLAARREDRPKSLARSIDNDGGTTQYQVTDVTDRDQAEALAKATMEAFSRIDVLINNAGLMPLSPLDALRVDEWAP